MREREGLMETVIKRWIVVHEPGKFPEKKSPHPNTHDGMIDFLIQLTLCREASTQYTLAELTWDHDLWVSSGREALAEERLTRPRIFANRVRALAEANAAWLKAEPRRIKDVSRGLIP